MADFAFVGWESSKLRGWVIDPVWGNRREVSQRRLLCENGGFVLREEQSYAFVLRVPSSTEFDLIYLFQSNLAVNSKNYRRISDRKMPPNRKSGTMIPWIDAGFARIYRHHAAKERSTRGWRADGRERSRRTRRQEQAAVHERTKEETASGTRPRRWRCVKVEVVVGSDLIIYAAGSRGLPLRFTTFRKQEQIERSSNVFSWLDSRAGSRTTHRKHLPLARWKDRPERFWYTLYLAAFDIVPTILTCNGQWSFYEPI